MDPSTTEQRGTDTELELGSNIPIENQRNREMQLVSTEQDNSGQLRRSARTEKPPQKIYL